MWHKSCAQFLFFQIIGQNAVNDGFQYPVLSAIILQLAQWSFFKTAATRGMFSLFPPFCFALRLQSTPHPPQTIYAMKYCSARNTNESPNAFTNISHIFAAINPALQQNFIAAHCSKLFSMVIYNTSIEHSATYGRIDFKFSM